uniref:xanthotoxin 5-hydroxylase CYP82C4-like n=1 Tax=Erigeron canadensis TaxID=72917 RepID=UPI001CB978D9|nr:xanthotoxin 5-hydroxylase CYP82C4-like [Erigeron canadensis]
MEAFLQFLPFFGLFLLSLIIYNYKRISTTKSIIKPLAPEPSGKLPFIGHLHLLHGQAPVARILGKMADDYGPAYSLRLGNHQALVVSSWQMVKECFTTNDRNFATRPNMAVSRYMGYNSAVFALAPYGPYWREIRKLVTLELLTSQRLERLKNVRDSEVKYLINELSVLVSKDTAQTSAVDMTKWFEHTTFNIIVRMLAGKRFSGGCNDKGDNEDIQVKEAIKKGLYLSGVFVVSDVIPNLEWLDIGGHVKAMKQAAIELDVVFGKWVDEHVEKRKERGSDKLEADFMDVMLSTLSNDAEMFGYGRETIIKATTLILILTGSESTAETLTWALSLLLNNPRVLKAAQKELEDHVGKNKWVEESDIKNLTYLQAIVKETLRMYPPGPLAGPREAIEKCYIGGYHVPKGTRLIVNVWKLHRDPQVWADPNDFKPERFLEKHSNINYQGQNFEYIPFSSGRRMCPASTFALQVIHLTLARLLQGFDYSTPNGKPVDMSEGLGIALPKVKPLEVIITPRLSPQLYQNL